MGFESYRQGAFTKRLADLPDHDVTAKQVYGRQSRTEKGSAYLYKLTDNILQANIKKGALKEK